MRVKQALLLGPVFSLKFNEDFNLTFVYLYGESDYKYRYNGPGFRTDYKSKRHDMDFALNYRLNNYFKVFAGIKYLALDIIPEFFSSYPYAEIYIHGKHKSFGVGLGLSATFPITENLFLLSTLSGLYLKGLGDEKAEVITSSGGTPQNIKSSFNDYGFNATLSLAYYIAQYGVVISLGGRVQYVTTKYDDSNFPFQDTFHNVYGITLTATYSFSI